MLNWFKKKSVFDKINSGPESEWMVDLILSSVCNVVIGVSCSASCSTNCLHWFAIKSDELWHSLTSSVVGLCGTNASLLFELCLNRYPRSQSMIWEFYIYLFIRSVGDLKCIFPLLSDDSGDHGALTWPNISRCIELCCWKKNPMYGWLDRRGLLYLTKLTIHNL